MEPKKKILVVDDEPSMCLLLQQFLNHHYEVVTKNDGVQALNWLHEGNLPNLIIADLQMPGMNGMELIDHLKDSSFFEQIPVVSLSAEEDTRQKITCLKKGAEDYVVKPFNPEELELRIHNILKRIPFQL